MEMYEYESIMVNTRQRRAFVNTIVVRLSWVEYAILLFFMENPGKWLSKAEIFGRIRNYSENHLIFNDEKLVDSHISSLKKALQQIDENAEDYIIGDEHGYKLGND
jgi:DNA-binding response OmpR family regulator